MKSFSCALAVACGLLTTFTALDAQEVQVAPSGARGRAGAAASPAANLTPEQQAALQAAERQAAEAKAKAAAAAGGEAKPAEANAAEKKEEPKPPFVSRPVAPPTPPDPKELELRPDADGLLSLNFGGQPWPAVLQWLADVSQLSLDWQELPNDYLNLRTQRKYTVEETQNLINRDLLVRGFTLLKSGERLSVRKVENLNPALLPRVVPNDLAERMDYEFVKVSFEMDWMLADQLINDLKPLLSANGKVTALKEVNQIEAIDTVINLRDLARVVRAAQSEDTTREILVQVFQIKHRRVADVQGMLLDILGMDRAKAMAGGGSPNDAMGRQLLQQMQQMQQMIQQSRNNNNQQGGGGGADKPPVEPKLVVNERENTLLVHAPPDKMEIIKRTIEAVDVPAAAGDDLITNMYRVKPYRLNMMDPQLLLNMLADMGQLSTQAKMHVDANTRTLVVSGNLADHYTVQSIVDRLDVASRHADVISLRRLQADMVAGTIMSLMNGESQNSNQRSPVVYYLSSSSSNQRGNTAPTEKPFKVEADIVHNRLLLWASDVEIQQIHQLLAKMGEIAPGTSNPATMRRFDVESPEQAAELLRRIRELWPEISPNQLQIQIPQQGPATPDASAERVAEPPAENRSTSNSPPLQVRSVAWQVPAGDDAAQLPEEFAPRAGGQEAGVAAANVPDINIQIRPDGKIVFGSPDTAALDRLEDLLLEFAPAPKDYKIFQMRYPTTWVLGIETILTDFFGADTEMETAYDPYYGYTYRQEKVTSPSMGKRKKLRFYSDIDSNTILVQGASPEQLQIIDELIKVYDRPMSSDPAQLRKTKIFHLQYSEAVSVAETVKQVYRDLLSANDPALQGNNGEKEKTQDSGFNVTYSYPSRNGEDSKDVPEAPQQYKFKGLISVGVDEISNAVVVSAAEGLMGDITDLIEKLDLLAQPNNRLQVIPLQNIDSQSLKNQLEKSFGLGLPKGGENNNNGNGNGENGNNNQNQPNNNGNGNNGNNGNRNNGNRRGGNVGSAFGR